MMGNMRKLPYNPTHSATMKRLLIVACLPLVFGCQREAVAPPVQAADRSAAPSPAQVREDGFRWKERCAVAAERFDKVFAERKRGPVETSVSEVFYSPPRNSCVCEVTAFGGNGKAGIQSMLTLYDCLTREDLGQTLLTFGSADFQQRTDAWKLTKDALKRTSTQ